MSDGNALARGRESHQRNRVTDLDAVLAETEAAEAELAALRADLDVLALRQRLIEALLENGAARAKLAELNGERRQAVAAGLFGLALLIAGLVLALAVVLAGGRT
jgi:hypothetical protein